MTTALMNERYESEKEPITVRGSTDYDGYNLEPSCCYQKNMSGSIQRMMDQHRPADHIVPVNVTVAEIIPATSMSSSHKFAGIKASLRSLKKLFRRVATALTGISKVDISIFGSAEQKDKIFFFYLYETMTIRQIHIVKTLKKNVHIIIISKQCDKITECNLSL